MWKLSAYLCGSMFYAEACFSGDSAKIGTKQATFDFAGIWEVQLNFVSVCWILCITDGAQRSV